MTQLTGARVKRGGVTSPYWYGTVYSVQINTGSDLRLRFQMPSKGGGDTQVQVEIPPGDFATILEGMCIVDRQAALQAMSQELSRQIALQPELQAKSKARAIASFVQGMGRRYFKTWRDNDRNVMKAVREIADEVRTETGVV